MFTFEGNTTEYDTTRLQLLLQTLIPVPVKYCQSFIFLLTRIYGVKHIRNNARIKRLISLLLRMKSQDDFLAYLCNQDFVKVTKDLVIPYLILIVTRIPVTIQ